jgi:uncharacterized protein
MTEQVADGNRPKAPHLRSRSFPLTGGAIALRYAMKTHLDRYGRSQLHYAPQHKPEVEQGALAERLIAEGCEVDQQDSQGWAPLHFAAQEWSVPVALVLIAKRAHVDIKDEHGNTPLSRAVFNSCGRGDLIKLLLDAGADPDMENDYGISPRDLAQSIANFDVAQHMPTKSYQVGAQNP